MLVAGKTTALATPTGNFQLGRLDDSSRFIANTRDDDATLDFMMREEIVGKRGSVSAGEKNLFVFTAT